MERVKGIEAFAHNPQVAEVKHIPGDDARAHTGQPSAVPVQLPIRLQLDRTFLGGQIS
jgi:hypothetical protein